MDSKNTTTKPRIGFAALIERLDTLTSHVYALICRVDQLVETLAPLIAQAPSNRSAAFIRTATRHQLMSAAKELRLTVESPDLVIINASAEELRALCLQKIENLSIP